MPTLRGEELGILTADKLRAMCLSFFADRGHAVIPSASLVPSDDPSVLLTTAGMHPLVPYLLGRPHPSGDKLVDYQKCDLSGHAGSDPGLLPPPGAVGSGVRPLASSSSAWRSIR